MDGLRVVGSGDGPGAVVSGAAPGFDFWDRQLGLLGDRDPLEVLEATPGKIEALVANHPPDDFRARPEPGTWCPTEVLGHLVDIEWVFGFRCRTIAFDEAPTFPGIDQERWVAGQGWAEADPSELSERFGALRRVSMTFWRSLGPKDLERAGRHEAADVLLTLGEMRSIQAGHDLVHLAQMRERLP